MAVGAERAMPSRMTLNDPSQAWRIVSGSVDIFLVEMDSGSERSRLEFLGTAGVNDVLVGATVQVENGLLATLVAEASEIVIVESLGFAANDAERRAIGPEQLDLWIAQLAAWCAPGLAPADSQQIEPGQQIEAGSDEVTLIGLRGVAWVSTSEAGLALYGAGCAGQRSMPVCRHLWVSTRTRQRLSCATTEEWWHVTSETGSVAERWGDVASAMLAARRQRRLLDEEAERLRFQQKIQRDSRVFAGALQELGTTILSDGAQRRGLSEIEGAYEVCRAVGEAMGVEMIAPIGAVSGETTEQAVIRVAEASNIRYRQVLLRNDWWTQDQGPMVGFTLNGVAVALLKQRGRGYTFSSASSGEAVAANAQLSASLDPRAYVFYRTFPHRKLGLRDLLEFGLRDGKTDIVMILGAGVLAGLLGMAMPVATGVLFDQVIPDGQRGNLVQLSVLLFSSSVSIFLMGLAQSFATQRLEGRMESAVSAAVWDRLLNLPTSFFRQYTTGDLASRSLAVNQIRQALTNSATSALLGGIFSLFSFALLFSYSVTLALAATALAGAAIVFSAVATLVMVKLNRRILAIEGTITGHVAEMLQGVAKFRISGTEPRAFARWAHDYALQKQAMLAAAKVSLATRLFNSVFPAITAIVLYAFAASMAHADPHFSTGRFLAFNAAFGQFLGAMLGVAAAVLSLVSIVPAYERARPILQELPELKPGLKKPGPLSGDIEVSHVGFRYRQDGPQVLDDVSFTIRPGQYVAFVGESGSGKSTLLRLLLGFESPAAGSISYDGQNLADLDMQAVRRQIGVVLQSGKLMSADIFTNIVGAALLGMDDAWRAAEGAGLADDIRAMPMGMHTVVNESGSGLSGGQRQRLLIARAIVHRPRLLFFDEATSALDNQTQSVVSRSLDVMQATRIVIAHRLSTVRHADAILVFKGGSLLEAGTFEELLEKDGYFADLAKRQLV